MPETFTNQLENFLDNQNPGGYVQTTVNIETSDLNNRINEIINSKGYITTETDPTVPAWAKLPEKPVYTATEVGAMPSNGISITDTLPAAEGRQALATINITGQEPVTIYGGSSSGGNSGSGSGDLSNLADVAFTGNYDDLINKPALFNRDFDTLLNIPEFITNFVENEVTSCLQFVFTDDLNNFLDNLPVARQTNFLFSTNTSILNLGSTDFYIENISTEPFNNQISILNYFLNIIQTYNAQQNLQTFISSFNIFLVTNISTIAIDQNNDNYIYCISLVGGLRNNFTELTGTPAQKLTNLTLTPQQSLIVVDPNEDILYFKNL